MSTVWSFLVKFASLIVCTLHCFDRVIFKGHLAMASATELERFVDFVLRVRRIDFMQTIAPHYSNAARMFVCSRPNGSVAGGELHPNDLAEVEARQYETIEEAHGRTDRRIYTQLPIPQDLPESWRRCTVCIRR